MENYRDQHYTITQVAELFEVNASLIRYWEKEFKVFKPKKNSRGNRYFTADDITIFKKIFLLVKKKGYTLQGAKDKLKEDALIALEKEAVVKKLENIKLRLIEINKQI